MIAPSREAAQRGRARARPQEVQAPMDSHCYSRALTAALQQHQDVAVAPELREQLAGFVAALLTTTITATASQEEKDAYTKTTNDLRRAAQARPVEHRLYYADYRNVDGVMLPFRRGFEKVLKDAKQPVPVIPQLSL